MTHRDGIEGRRQFLAAGEFYTVEVYWSVGWRYRFASDTRGVLDDGPLSTDSPWTEVERMFPECA